MLTELINFTDSLSDDFKALGLKPKEGMHILLPVDEVGNINTKLENIEYTFYSKKPKSKENILLEKLKKLQENSWCINTNKCFDPKKAIHTCSPLAVAFKKEHLEGGEKYRINNEKGNDQIQERFGIYFGKSKSLLTEDMRTQKAAENFREIFISQSWEGVLSDIETQRNIRFKLLSEREETIKTQIGNCSDKDEKEFLKEKLLNLQEELLHVRPLLESDYLLFYLDLPLELYKATHAKYLDDKLFNTPTYSTNPNDKGIIYGTNDFQNGFNSKMPFLLHKTASFDISGRISNIAAKTLYELSKVLPRKTLPNPLPIFIYADEHLNEKAIAIYKEGRLSFRELVESLYGDHKKDFQNYYLLHWVNTPKGIVFKDYDFVAKFEYEINPPIGLEIRNYFNLYENKRPKYYPPVKNIFELEDRIFKTFLQDKFKNLEYFSDIKKDKYDNKNFTFLSYCKYRKAIYDYVYKSNRSNIGGRQFNEMVFNAIRDDFKNNNEYGIKEKLNYWYSLNEFFNKKNNSMASKLKNYQDFVLQLKEGSCNTENATDKQFAFSAGQVINYLLKKSKSEDTSFRLMEPYMQKKNCEALKQSIAEDFARYKHENFSGNYKKVAAFVLSYETEKSMKTLQPELLSGLFSTNQLFSNQNKND